MNAADLIARLPMNLIRLAGTKHGVEPSLIAAICLKESGGNEFAMRFEPSYRYFWKIESSAKALTCSTDTERNGQATSWGLMQVMGGVLREAGFKGWFGLALDPKTNLDYGTRHLKRFIDRYAGNTVAAIAAYNAGSARITDSGDFINQSYVDGVLEYKAAIDGLGKKLP